MRNFTGKKKPPPPRYVRVAAVDHIVDEKSTDKALFVSIPGAEIDGRTVPIQFFIPKSIAMIQPDFPRARYSRCIWAPTWFAKQKFLPEFINPVGGA